MAETKPTTRDWTSTPYVQQHIASAAKYLAESFSDHVSRWYAFSSHDSPLEIAFEIWWRALAQAYSIDGETVRWERQVEVMAGGNAYRLDYQLLPNHLFTAKAKQLGVSIAKIGVELDGHDFHEKTKAQVAYRNQRDRDLAADGWLILHFSGAEFQRDPFGCIDEAFGHAYRAFGMEFEHSVIDAEIAAEREAANKADALTGN